MCALVMAAIIWHAQLCYCWMLCAVTKLICPDSGSHKAPVILQIKIKYTKFSWVWAKWGQELFCLKQFCEWVCNHFCDSSWLLNTLALRQQTSGSVAHGIFTAGWLWIWSSTLCGNVLGLYGFHKWKRYKLSILCGKSSKHKGIWWFTVDGNKLLLILPTLLSLFNVYFPPYAH